MSKTGTIFPVIAGGNAKNIVAEIFIEKKINTVDDDNAIKMGLSPIIMKMMPAGIYSKAYNALQQVQAFIVYRKSNNIDILINHPLFNFLKVPKWILYDIFDLLFNLFTYTHTDWLKKLRLHINGIVSAKVEGDSCELSIALTLLLSSNPKALSDNTCVIATGALSGLGGKVHINEVGNILEKLQLALDEKKKGRAGLLPSDYYIFYTPIYVDNLKSQKIINCPEIKLLKKVGIEVRPRSELKDIVDELNLLPNRLAYKRRWLTGFILASSLLIGSYKDPKIEVGFYPIKKGFTAEPFLICNKYEGRFVKYFPFKKDGSYHIVNMPTKAIDHWYVDMGWLIKMPKETGLNAYYPKSWQGYHLTYINIADKTGLTIYPEEKKLQGGDIIKKRWQLKEPAKEEGGLLAIVASYQPLNLIKLEADLRKIPRENHSRIRNHLSKNYNSVLFFHYLVKLKPSRCSF